MSGRLTNIKIFVEGPDDSAFIKACIHKWLGDEVSSSGASKDGDGTIIELGGFSKHVMDFGLSVPKVVRELKVQQTSKVSWTNLFIFDADDERKDPKNGGHAKRKAYIQQQARDKGISIADEAIFLLPFNAQYPASENPIREGDLESLLLRITAIPAITNCWDNYENCIKPYLREQHTLSRKSKVFSYAEALTNFASAGGRDRDYQKIDHWNLDPASPYLLPLYDFLKAHFDSIPTSQTP
jgi:hypothetical protein